MPPAVHLGISRTAGALCRSGFWLLFASAGCSVFDEGLIPDDAGPPPDSLELAVGENVGCDIPSNASLNNYHDAIDTALKVNDRARLPDCLGELPAPGGDVFFRVGMQQNEKWHFHVDTTQSLDPAIYIFPSCTDTRGCADSLSGVNACGVGQPEHFSFIAPATGEYVVGLDSLTSGGENVRIFGVHADCGNGIVEHSEYCDTGPASPPADCVGCRKVLDNGGEDGTNSLNDGPLDGTRLRIADPATPQTFRVLGVLDKSCDFDFFQFEVARPVRVTATLEAPNACSGTDLKLADSAPFALAATNPTACPTLAPRDLAAGTHWVRVAGRPELGAERPAYVLSLLVEPR